MKPFIKNILYFLLLGFIPMAILTFGYVYFDPFKVVKSYSNYSYPFVVPNKDYISTEMFLKNNSIQDYNSFVFGSSRTNAFRPSVWSNYLPIDSKPFVFDASKETIYGIYTKLKFLDSLKTTNLKNVLIILCRDYSFDYEKNSEGHLFLKHPITSKKNNIAFHFEFYKAYLDPKFLYCFYDYTLTKNYKSYMKGYIEFRKITYDTLTNETNIIDQEQEITQNPNAYYAKRASIFYERVGEKTDTIKRINKTNYFMLKEIKRILDKNKTNYKIVLSPLYEQIKFNSNDLFILKSIFKNNIYDFSGKNYFTQKKINYYEASHYRPTVGDSIFKIIYK